MRLSNRVWMALVVGALVLGWAFGQLTPKAASDSGPAPTSAPAQTSEQQVPRTQGLPPEAIETLRKIQNGERLPYRRDGVVFENRERLLPQKPRGYYHEYTVPTPGVKTRGARRIVTGGQPPEVWYYSDDHYRSVKEVQP